MGSTLTHSDMFVIDSYENGCAIKAGLSIINRFSISNILFICFDDEFSTKQLIQESSRANALKEESKFVFLKDSWQKIHDEHGHKKFIEELISFVNQSNTKAVFFYRIDKILIDLFEKDSKLLIKKLFEELKKDSIKVILSYDRTTIYGRVLREYIGKEINIEYRLKSDEDCSFELIEYKNNQEYFEVLLLSSDKEFIYTNKKLFDKKDRFVFLDKKLKEFVNNPKNINFDLVIIDDDSDRLNVNLMENIRDNKKEIKIIYLNRKRALRIEDKITLKEHNIMYIDTKSDFEKYIEKLEFAIGRNFYLKRVQNFLDQSSSQKADDLEDAIQRLEENGILFSLVSIKDKKLKNARANDLKSLIREYDFVFKKSSSGEFFLVLINLLGENTKKILAKRLSTKKKMIKLYKQPINIS